MFDRRLRQYCDPPLDRFAAILAARGWPADGLTWAGFALGLLAMLAIANAAYLCGLAFFLGNRLLDGLDGAVARAGRAFGRGPSDRGAYLDILLDFLIYAGFVFAFAWAVPDRGLAAAFLIFSFVGTGASFLAFAVFAPARDAKKGFAHLGGLTEGGETIAVFILFCLFPESFATIAWIFGGLCWLTTFGRLRAALRLLPPAR